MNVSYAKLYQQIYIGKKPHTYLDAERHGYKIRFIEGTGIEVDSSAEYTTIITLNNIEFLRLDKDEDLSKPPKAK